MPTCSSMTSLFRKKFHKYPNIPFLFRIRRHWLENSLVLNMGEHYLSAPYIEILCLIIYFPLMSYLWWEVFPHIFLLIRMRIQFRYSVINHHYQERENMPSYNIRINFVGSFLSATTLLYLFVRFSRGKIFQRKIERINTVARHVLL